MTALEFDLFFQPRLYGGRMVWRGDRVHAVWEAFLDLTADAPSWLSIWFHTLQPRDAAPMVALDIACLGDPDTVRPLLVRLDMIGGLITDRCGALSPARIGDITAEPTRPTAAIFRAELFTGMGEATTCLLLDEPLTPLTDIQIRHLGGALAEDQPGHGALGAVTEPYALTLLAPGLPHLVDHAHTTQRRLARARAQWTQTLYSPRPR